MHGNMAHGSKPGFWNSPFFLQILHALLPVKCSSCEEDLWDDPIPFFCARCWATIQPINGPACARCHYPFTSSVALQFSPDHTCSNCRLHPPAYTRAWAPFPYQTPLKEAIGLFKYQGKVSLAHPLADLLLAALGSLPPIDLILPVPLHPKRLREREYNQSLLLTNRLSQNLNVPLSYTNLIRIRNTPPQISLKRKDRDRKSVV
jgi:predicted amidophosphoribosyltransferase